MNANRTLSNEAIVRACRPWYPAWSLAFQTGFDDMMATVPFTGITRPGERAVIAHATTRRSLGELCDFASPWLTLVEEPENAGRLDYMRLDWGGIQIAVRWGRYKDRRISRRDSRRQEGIQEQGVLFNGMDREIEELPTVTIGYTVEQEFSLGGVPQWFMGRLVLIRERIDDSEPIQEIDSFSPPGVVELPDYAGTARVVARESEIERIRRIVESIRKHAG